MGDGEDYWEGTVQDLSVRIWEAAVKQGLTERTLFRARGELKIRTQRVWIDRRQHCYWLLPGQQLPDSVSPEAVADDLEPWLAPLRERFPPPTPLDEM